MTVMAQVAPGAEPATFPDRERPGTLEINDSQDMVKTFVDVCCLTMVTDMVKSLQ